MTSYQNLFSRSLALLVLLVFFASCDNTVTNPAGNIGTEKEPIDSTGFAIVASTPDTLYYGEEAWVEAHELGTNTLDLQLFLHTVEVPMEDMKIEGNRLIFTVPRNASTGKIRLYKHDTLLAKNNFTLHVLPHHVNEFQTQPDYYTPREGYAGETILIRVNDLPLRRSEFDVFIDEIKLNLIEWDTTFIHAEIPPHVRKGMLRLRAFNSFFQLGSFEVLAQGGIFLEGDKVTWITAGGTMLLGATEGEFREKDSVQTFGFPFIEFDNVVFCDNSAEVTRTDSLRLSSLHTEGGDAYTVEVALKTATGRNKVSGRIQMTHYSNKGTENEQMFSTTLVVKDISWKLFNNMYVLYANGKEITDKVISLDHEIKQTGAHSSIQKAVNYHGGENFSTFQVAFAR